MFEALQEVIDQLNTHSIKKRKEKKKFSWISQMSFLKVQNNDRN